MIGKFTLFSFCKDKSLSIQLLSVNKEVTVLECIHELGEASPNSTDLKRIVQPSGGVRREVQTSTVILTLKESLLNRQQLNCLR